MGKTNEKKKADETHHLERERDNQRDIDISRTCRGGVVVVILMKSIRQVSTTVAPLPLLIHIRPINIQSALAKKMEVTTTKRDSVAITCRSV